MKLVNWMRFSWDLPNLPAVNLDLAEHYQIRAATREDEKEIRRVIVASFALDSTWGDVMHDLNDLLDLWQKRAFEPEQGVCLALTHGLRIIGAVVLLLDPAAESHLAPGPCVLMEYRNRGLGTALLGSSLQYLRDAGFSQAFAIAKDTAPVAKFLYPKYNGTVAPHEFTALVAA